MPVRPLPLDLLPLIFQHLEDDLDELDKRDTAKQLMLVCKAWKPFAEELAYRELTFVLNRDEGLLDLLVKRKTLLRHVRTLNASTFKSRAAAARANPGDEETGAVTDRIAAPFLEFVSACSHLEHLFLPPCLPHVALLSRAASSASAGSLKELNLVLKSEGMFSVDSLVSHLQLFHSLKHLSINIGQFADVPSLPLSRVPTTKLSLVTFTFACFDDFSTNLEHHLGVAFLELISQETLEEFELKGWSGNCTFFRSLDAFRHLESLSLTFHKAVHISVALPSILKILPGLLALRTLTLGVKYPSGPNFLATMPAAVDIGTFLAALPPNLQQGWVSDVYFNAPAEFYHEPLTEQFLKAPKMSVVVRPDAPMSILADFPDLAGPRRYGLRKVSTGIGKKEWKVQCQIEAAMTDTGRNSPKAAGNVLCGECEA
ncbi:hypothetical protein JCM10207_006516 [Rhodosporidiobolus poonsookiae]